MNTDLFENLVKSAPTQNMTPKENFLTEIFAWILKNYDGLAVGLVNWLFLLELDDQSEVLCETQVNFNGKYPDMVLEIDNYHFVFEHKVDSELHCDQLKNYKSYATNNLENYRIVLITTSKSQHTSPLSDRNICWYEIYSFLDDHINERPEIQDRIVLDSFLYFLKHEGLGPMEALNYANIQYYNCAERLETETKNLLDILISRKREEIENLFGTPFDSKIKYHWGRIGLSYYNNWNPGIFVGFHLNPKDHKVPAEYWKASPFFVVIIDFDSRFHKSYTTDKTYQDFRLDLREVVNASSMNWSIFDIENQRFSKNLWHPLHVRIPMTEVFYGCESLEDQIDSVMRYIEEIVPKIVNLESFMAMQKKFK